jgi:hypothetical protein
MKCQKCGYVSFDYLSQCKKCGADLTAARGLLGFSELKSEVPSLLGALLRDDGKSDGTQAKAAAEVVGVTEEGPPRLQLPEVQGPEQPGEKSSQASERESIPGRTSKDELVIELSEDDLEALAGIEKK